MTPVQMIADARKNNPNIRYALRAEPAEGGGAVLGAFCTRAGGFIPVAFQDGRTWQRMPAVYLEIDGASVGIEPENWRE